MAPQLVPADTDWHEWRERPAPRGKGRTRILVHLTEARDGRFHLDGLRIDGAVSASLLRSIPVGRIEAAANAQFHGAAPPPGKGRAVNARIPNSLRASTVQGYSDGFYETVGKAYQSLARSSSKPVADLAAANDVPVTTAQRWVREARRRGKLPPGRPGKAG